MTRTRLLGIIAVVASAFFVSTGGSPQDTRTSNQNLKPSITPSGPNQTRTSETPSKSNTTQLDARIQEIMLRPEFHNARWGMQFYSPDTRERNFLIQIRSSLQGDWGPCVSLLIFFGLRFTSNGSSGFPPFSQALTIMDATPLMESLRRCSRMWRVFKKNLSK
jgi:hypothetical protein